MIKTFFIKLRVIFQLKIAIYGINHKKIFKYNIYREIKLTSKNIIIFQRLFISLNKTLLKLELNLKYLII